jgi:hypothetical protein
VLTRRHAIATLGASLCAAPALAQTVLSNGPTHNHPQLDAAVAELREQRWDELVARYRALPAQSALVLLDDLGNAVEADPDVSVLRGAEGGHVLLDGRRADISGLRSVDGGNAVLSALRITIAWRHRGTGRGDTVTNEGAFAFYRWLEAAKLALRRAVQADPQDGVLFAQLFRVYKGLNERRDLERALPLFLAAARKPVHGLSSYCDAISAKWHGTEAEALAFGRSHADAIPPASHAIVADMHLISAAGRSMSDDPLVSATADEYFQQPEVSDEIVLAHERFIDAPPDTDEFAAKYAHSVFSFAFMKLNDTERLRAHLAALGDYRGYPWPSLRGEENALIDQLRQSLGLSET